jgi:hypothetical protein
MEGDRKLPGKARRQRDGVRGAQAVLSRIERDRDVLPGNSGGEADAGEERKEQKEQKEAASGNEIHPVLVALFHDETSIRD